MGNLCCRKKLKRTIVLLLLGLDNAGKTAAAKGLAGESLETVVPTIGFSVINLQYLDYKVKIFDLGGRHDIRGIWDRYFVDAHGIIFVVDSTDYLRLDEAYNVFKELVAHEKIMGKPILILANKQDNEDALDEIDLVEKLQIETLVNNSQCPAMVQSCSALTDSKYIKPDKGITIGYQWLLNYVIKDYKQLNERVKEDVDIQEKINHQNRLKIIERLKQLKTETNESPNVGKFIIDTKEEIKNSSNISIQSDTSSFPHVYNENLEDIQQKIAERPKSAVAAVRQQLENKSLHKNSSNLSFFSSGKNKTSPAVIFDVQRPGSASSVTKIVSKNVTEVKPILATSTGDGMNNISNKQDISYGPNGDASNQEVFILSDINKINKQTSKQKLPPLKAISNSNSELSVQVHVRLSPEQTNSNKISVIDID